MTLGIINIISQNIENYLNLMISEIETRYPNRTDSFYKCVRDMRYVLEAYCLDLSEGGSRHVHMVISQFYKGKTLQLKNTEVESWAHERLVDIICLDDSINYEEKNKLRLLFSIIQNSFKNDNYKNSYDYLDNLVYNRISYSKFKPTPVDSIKTAKILNAADGLSPALAHNYHYRVDVVPETLKKKVWPYMHSFYDWAVPGLKENFIKNIDSKTPDEWRELGVCYNWHFQAPLVLCYSMPLPNDTIQMWDGPERFPTSREATTISIGLNLWNVMMTVESLGLNSCLCKAFTNEATDMIRLNTTEDIGNNRWTPTIFLCIGEGLVSKGDHREYKPMSIVNNLTFEE